MSLVEFMILSLATWRISSLLTQEAGPGNIFLHIRESVGIGHDIEKDPVMIPDGFWPGLLSCVWCCSVWVAAALFIDYLIFPKITIWICTVPAMSTVAILTNHYA